MNNFLIMIIILFLILYIIIYSFILEYINLTFEYDFWECISLFLVLPLILIVAIFLGIAYLGHLIINKIEK